MKFRLACSDYSFPLMPQDDVFKLVTMLGFAGIDIGVFEGRSHIRPSQVIGNVAGAASQLTQRVKDAGLELADIFYQASSFSDMAANHPDPAVQSQGRDLFRHMLDFAQHCGAAHMTGLPGIEWPGEPRETSLARSAEELAWRAAEAQRAGIVYSVECHLESIAPTPAAARQLIEMSPGLSLTLDYSHFIHQGYSQDECDALIPYAKHFHARAATKGRLQAPMKANVIDFAQALRGLEKAGYNGYIGVEYVWTEWYQTNEVDNVSETILLRDQLLGLMQ
jgi:sugar phosphate isomerase/epimerase